MLDRKRPYLEQLDCIFFQCLASVEDIGDEYLFLGQVTEVISHDMARMCRTALVKIIGLKSISTGATTHFYGKTAVVLQYSTGNLEITAGMLVGGSEKIGVERWGILVGPERVVCPQLVEKTLKSLFNIEHVASEDPRNRGHLALQALVTAVDSFEPGELLATILVLFDVNDDDVRYARLLCSKIRN